jgi:sugar phosphate isomerase/epimerase
MQGLLFGSQGLNLFGSEAVQQQMLERLEAVCRIAAGLGARRLVFGAARHRDRSGLSDEAALEHATRFFRRFGAVASRYAQSVCVEPVPATAGSNFLLDSRSAEELVARVDHAALRLQFDTGALVASGEDPAEILARAADRIGHIHASEAGLGPLGSGRPDHAAIGALLRSSLPAHVVCVELLAGSAEARLEAIRRSLEVARRCYGDPPR